MALISYIVITMNRQDAVIKCLQNIQRQTYQQREIIVVDNGSSDRTRSMILELFPEVRLITCPTNLGVAGGRNRGILAATGDILIFIDDDAQFQCERASEKTIELFESNAQIAIINYTIINPHTKRLEHAAIPRSDKSSTSRSSQVAYFCGCGFAMRRQVVEAIGYFWDRLFYSGEELEYSYRLASQDFKIFSTNEIVVYHDKDPRARPRGQFVYFNARNRLLIATRWLPLSAIVTNAVIWWMYLAFVAIRHGWLSDLSRGIRDGIKLLPEAWALRSPLKKDELSNIRLAFGRIWY